MGTLIVAVTPASALHGTPPELTEGSCVTLLHGDFVRTKSVKTCTVLGGADASYGDGADINIGPVQVGDWYYNYHYNANWQVEQSMFTVTTYTQKGNSRVTVVTVDNEFADGPYVYAQCNWDTQRTLNPDSGNWEDTAPQGGGDTSMGNTSQILPCIGQGMYPADVQDLLDEL